MTARRINESTCPGIAYKGCLPVVADLGILIRSRFMEAVAPLASVARLCAVGVSLVSLVTSVAAVPATIQEQVRILYSYFRVERAALSPDGKRVAFAVLSEGALQFEVQETSNPGGNRVTLPASVPIDSLDFLAWASPDRLVAVTGRGVILVNDGKWSRMKQLADASTFARTRRNVGAPPRLRVLGLVPGDPEGLRVEINAPVSEDVTSLELHRIDLASGEHARLFEQPMDRRGGMLIIDRQGQARLVLARDRLPQRFEYLAPGERGEGTNLDAVLRDRAAFGFSVVPANLLGERTIPVGFGTDPDLFYFATNFGRDTYALEAVKLSSGHRTPFLVEDAADVVGLEAPWMESPLVFDRQRQHLVGVRLPGAVGDRWIDGEIAAVHRDLAQKFPVRDVQLIEWDDTRQHFLLLVSSPADPGRYFVHDRISDRTTEFHARLPGLDPDLQGRTEHLLLAAPTGGQFKAIFTSPQTGDQTPPPLVVWLYDGPWKGRSAPFRRDAQALAGLGYATLEIEYAGSAGDGRARRQVIRAGYDKVPLNEVLTALDVLRTRHSFDPARVAVVGDGFGGYLALRALQLHPDQFQCGVAINGATDPADLWRAMLEPRSEVTFGGQKDRGDLSDAATVDARAAAEFEATTARLIALPPLSADFGSAFARWVIRESKWTGLAVTPQAQRITRPVLLFQDPRNRRVPADSIAALRRELKRLHRPAEYFELSADVTRMEVTMRIDEFLRDHLPAAAQPRSAP